MLPVDAHKLCTDRVHISLTRWKDGKNFLVNKFDTREELIQVFFVYFLIINFTFIKY